MKNCIKCTSPLNDEDKFCPICGTRQTPERRIRANFCSECGTSISHDIKYCPQCGNLVGNELTNQVLKNATPPMIQVLSRRITLVSVFWMVIASMQLSLGILLFFIALFLGEWSSDNIIALILYFSLGGLNLTESIKMLKYKQKILNDYVGIVWSNRIGVSTCLNYIWNAYVVFNGLVYKNIFSVFFALVIASAIIIDFLTIKIFVLKNRNSFLLLEKAQVGEE